MFELKVFKYNKYNNNNDANINIITITKFRTRARETDFLVVVVVVGWKHIIEIYIFPPTHIRFFINKILKNHKQASTYTHKI